MKPSMTTSKSTTPSFAPIDPLYGPVNNIKTDFAEFHDIMQSYNSSKLADVFYSLDLKDMIWGNDLKSRIYIMPESKYKEIPVGLKPDWDYIWYHRPFTVCLRGDLESPKEQPSLVTSYVPSTDRFLRIVINKFKVGDHQFWLMKDRDADIFLYAVQKLREFEIHLWDSKNLRMTSPSEQVGYMNAFIELRIQYLKSLDLYEL